MQRLSCVVRRRYGFFRVIAFAGLCPVIAAGCGGGGQHTTPPVGTRLSATAEPVATTGPQGSVLIRVEIPAAHAASAARRRPAYVSPDTNSITFAQNGTLVATLPLAAGAPNCTATGGGGRTCTVSASAASGVNQVLTVQTFASTDGSGTPLSRQTITATITAGAVNPLSMTLNGVVASVTAAFAASTLPYGVSGTTTLVVNARDASGATIVGPGTFVDAGGNPVTITLTNADGTGATTLGTTSLTQPGAGVPFTYAGAAILGDSVAATAPGITASTATIAFTCSAPSTASAIYQSDFTGPGGNAGYAEYSLSASGPNPTPDVIVDPPGLGFGAVAVDVLGHAYVPGASASIAQFCPQASGTAAVPYRTVVVPNTDSVAAFATDSARNLYALDLDSGGNHVIREFAPDAGAPGFPASSATNTTALRTITGSATAMDLGGLIADLATANGNIYAAGGSYDSVLIFGPGQNGNVAPASTFANTVSGLSAPLAMAYDAGGNLYVLYSEDRRTSLAPGATGRPAIAEFTPASHTMPVRVISGPATGIQAPITIATDGAGNIYFVGSSDKVERFGPAANGDVAPDATFPFAVGPSQESPQMKMAIDPSSGRIYICVSAPGAGTQANKVVVLSGTGALVGEIGPTPNGIGTPLGIAFDPSGNFVVFSDQLTVGATTYGLQALEYYPAGTVAAPASGPTRIVHVEGLAYNEANLGNTSQIARDAAGNVFVHIPGGAAEYAAGAATDDPPISSFIDQNLIVGIVHARSEQIAVAPSGTIAFLSGTSEAVYTYPSGTSGTNALPTGSYFAFLPTTHLAFLVATDAAGNLYVTGSASIEEFAPGSTTPIRSIAGPHTRLNAPTDLAVDGAGNLYVANQFGTVVSVFGAAATGDAAPTRIIGQSVETAYRLNVFAIGIGPGGVGVTSTARAPSSAASGSARRRQTTSSVGIAQQRSVRVRAICMNLLRAEGPRRRNPAAFCGPVVRQR